MRGFLLLLLPCLSFAGEVYRVKLEDGLPFGKQRSDVEIELPATAGARAWAWTPMTPGQENLGSVIEAKREGDAFRAQVRLLVNHERARKGVVLGGEAEFNFELKQVGDVWMGTYRGVTQDRNTPERHRQLEEAWGWGFKPVGHAFMQPLIRNRLTAALTNLTFQGRATGKLVQSPFGNSFTVAAGEHPRLFFRKAELDELRRRTATPEGKKIMASLNEMLERAERAGFGFQDGCAEHMMYGTWAAGHGLMHQLTGDKSHADKAMGLGVGAMYGPYYYGGWWIHPYQVMGLAMAYDMCQDAWPADYRDMVYCFLFQNVRDLAMRHDEVDLLGTRRLYGFANDQDRFTVDSPRDFDSMKLRAAAAIAALAIRGDRVPVYKPAPLDTVKQIEPATDYVPWAGVPVVSFTDGRMPDKWLVNGPFRRGLLPDPLIELGGYAKARPEPGTIVTHDGTKLDFRWYWPAGQGDEVRGPRIYPRDCNRFWTSSTGGGYYTGIELVKRWRDQLGRGPGIEVAIYTVLDNDGERVVQARPNWGWNSFGIRMWLNGVEVRDGDLVRLKPGLYPLICQVPVMGGYANQGPNLREYTGEDFGKDMAAWERAQTAFNASGTGMAEMDRNIEVLARSVRRFMDDQIAGDGSGGWNDAIYESLFPMLLAYRNLTGNDLAAGTGVQEVITQAVRTRGGRRGEGRPTMVAQSLALMPEKYKPVAVWYMDKEGLALRRPHDCLLALTTYPLGVKPQHPRELFKLPATYAGHGLHLFPSSWDAAGSFLVRLEHGAAPMSSPFAFGNVAIAGFGRDWTPMHVKRYRWEEQFGLNRLSIHDHFHMDGGRVVHSELRDDGSGVVSIVADKFKRGEVVNNTGGPGQHIVWDNKHQPQATLLRSVAVDYSGASGAPALIVIADRVSGLTANSEKIWRMDLGGVAESLIVDAEKKLFLVGYNKKTKKRVDGPTMQGVFISPGMLDLQPARYGDGQGVALQAKADRRISDRERVESGHAKELAKEVRQDKRTDPADNIIADFDKHLDKQARAAQTADVVFLLIITLQTGEPPTIEVAGTDAKVGKQKVFFDGQKVVISP